VINFILKYFLPYDLNYFAFLVSVRHKRPLIMVDKLIKERKSLKFRNEIKHNF
jgi:hypothetical protein